MWLVACGDDDLLFKLAESSKMCVGNDIIWSQIKIMADKSSSTHHNLFFTNHDACALPFKIKFDLTLCKNLLHHMHNKSELENLLQSLRSVSSRILLVDPEDPQKGSFKAKVWNWYYRILLKDQGEKFVTMEFFKDIIKEYFNDATEIKFKRVPTIKGNYMFGYIDISTSKSVATSTSSSVSRTKAIIFDLDGLLVNTEPPFLKAIKFVLNEKGIQISDKEYIETDLQNGSSILEKLLLKGSIKSKIELDDIKNKIYEKYFDSIKTELNPMPHALLAIERIKPVFRLAIASSSKKIYIDFILSKLNLTELFEVIISREDVEKVKPNPECLLKAISKLNLSSDECVVIEDSLRGVKAAQSAGIKVIVVPNGLTQNTNYENAVVLKSLEELTSEMLLTLN